MGGVIYLNEIDPFCAQWLQNLMDADVIPRGHIDTRSIEDVTPNDLAGYHQCHFFAGLGGWIYALDLAGWPRDRPVWTGSCPCQPFSAAGKGAGFEDERHLWPAWQHLIAQCGPPVVFGEQVASKDADAWIDLVHADMEGMGYAFGSVPFPATGIGAPHIRDRNYWMAHADGRNASAEREQCGGQQRQQQEDGGTRGLDDTERAGLEGHRPDQGQGGRIGEAGSVTAASAFDFWADLEWIECSDGKARPTQPGLFPLAHGIQNRVGRLRAYGNAIVPQVAAVFVMANV